MNPLIKWAGGKSSEIKNIKQIIPSFDRYIEPFFGGGALFFYLEPKRAVINDISKELMTFYKFIKNGKRKEFKKELDAYVEYWNRINTYMKKFGNSIIILYKEYRDNKLSETNFVEKIKDLFAKKIVPFNGLFSKKFCINQKWLLGSIENNMIAKLERTKNKIDVKREFTDKMIMDNIETAFRSGFYIHFRDIMNRAKKGEVKIPITKAIANYYFVREFCYGSMFRFNRAGDFNIPYGGMAYNKKDFKRKVDSIFSDKVRRLLKNARVMNIDFKGMMEKTKPTKKDFVFFDPPYDTEFSGYEETPFDKKDQERLAKMIYNLKAKFILIIKETDFIRQLYDNKKFRDRGIRIESFGKKYSYNVRGRNIRDVRHLIIHNLKPIQKTLSNL